jgi:LPXTG-motif cell wall-anchored protein
MDDTIFTEFIILAGIIGAVLAFLIVRRWREE